MNPEISIIIPCYNSGAYLTEAIASVENYPAKELYEIIIVNDGSTDEKTIQLLTGLSNSTKSYVVIHQENQGPGAARNTGVKACKGDYLLFLDSDNRVRPEYIDIGISVLKENPEVGVVYGNASFFGSSTKPRFSPKEFNMFHMLMGNYIDICSVVRKKAWESIDGFDESRIVIGHEDWEFWIRIADKGWRFYHVEKILFDYRVSETSLITQVTSTNHIIEMQKYVFKKNGYIVAKNYMDIMQAYKTYHTDKKYPFRSFIKYLYFKYLLHKNGEPKSKKLDRMLKNILKSGGV